jgi:hypothetical protein
MERLVLGAVLGETDCTLNHGSILAPKAIDFVRQKFDGFEIVIPVCKACISKLYSLEWRLWYCMECTSSKWIHISNSKLKYLYKGEENIIWIKMCPVCYTGNIDNRQEQKQKQEQGE